MNDQLCIKLYHELSEKALEKVFRKFQEKPKLILTESDLKCWLFLELTNEIGSIQNSTLSVHTEITHYLKSDDKKNRRFRDLTILDSTKLDLNEHIWKNNDNGDYTLNKGFKHNGPAMHFELKLIRQGLLEYDQGKLDSSDINNLNNVDIGNRGYTIVWASKNDKCNMESLELKLRESFETFDRFGLIDNDLLRVYLFDQNSYKSCRFDREKNLIEINSL
ncbi:MAG: hypothetical protein E2590_18160 [Chryseobacterium sp.]|jgi:hypothetical protein|nr:hypothetical protein [Chryseobacterium sp.]